MRDSRPVAGSAAKSADDIPIAQRDNYVPAASNKSVSGLRHQHQVLVHSIWLVGGLTVATIVLAIGVQMLKNNGSSSAVVTPSPPSVADNTDMVLGHFRYAEAPADRLAAIDGGFRLRRAAAEKFQAMVSAARNAGVNIVTISAFRSVAEQKHLFFDIKAAPGQVTAKRAEVSAPPNYSEHHTGYAVDVGDGTNPAANLNQSFENTAAFKWLQANAPRYSFELSFPRRNVQGVSYEPWHWRYVGDSESLETFYKAKKAQS